MCPVNDALDRIALCQGPIKHLELREWARRNRPTLADLDAGLGLDLHKTLFRARQSRSEPVHISESHLERAIGQRISIWHYSLQEIWPSPLWPTLQHERFRHIANIILAIGDRGIAYNRSVEGPIGDFSLPRLK